jgi:ACR3 family arsenite transporter
MEGVQLQDVEDNSNNELEVDDEPQDEAKKLNLFQRFLSIWVLICMAIGILLGYYVPAIADGLNSATIDDVSIPIAVLLWGIILPMMLQIDFSSIANVMKQPRPIIATSFINYGIQPFMMYGLAQLFFRVIFIGYLGDDKAGQYLIGAVLLGGAPCTAMVFVWSTLMNGDAAYTVAQVAVNDILLVILYSPTVKLLAGAANIHMPWGTLLFSIGFFVVIPLVFGVVTRQIMMREESRAAFLEKKMIPVLDSLSMVFLLLMVILLFISQAEKIVHNLVDILIIAIPLLLQTFIIYAISYGTSWLMRFPYEIAGPASLIACSNFFELAVAVAASLYGADSGAALATVVGVLIEVPVMLLLVKINNRTKHIFQQRFLERKQ